MKNKILSEFSKQCGLTLKSQIFFINGKHPLCKLKGDTVNRCLDVVEELDVTIKDLSLEIKSMDKKYEDASVLGRRDDSPYYYPNGTSASYRLRQVNLLKNSGERQ